MTTISRAFPGVYTALAASAAAVAFLVMPVVNVEGIVGKFRVQLASAPSTPRPAGGQGQPRPVPEMDMTMARRMLHEALAVADSSGESVALDPQTTHTHDRSSSPSSSRFRPIGLTSMSNQETLWMFRVPRFLHRFEPESWRTPLTPTTSAESRPRK